MILGGRLAGEPWATVPWAAADLEAAGLPLAAAGYERHSYSVPAAGLQARQLPAARLVDACAVNSRFVVGRWPCRSTGVTGYMVVPGGGSTFSPGDAGSSRLLLPGPAEPDAKQVSAWQRTVYKTVDVRGRRSYQQGTATTGATRTSQLDSSLHTTTCWVLVLVQPQPLRQLALVHLALTLTLCWFHHSLGLSSLTFGGIPQIARSMCCMRARWRALP